MREYLELGPCPPEEDAVQTTDPDYYHKAQAQCGRYIGILRSRFGEEPDGAKLRVRGFQHDFGTYYEVVCYYWNEEGCDYAFMLEREG